MKHVKYLLVGICLLLLGFAIGGVAIIVLNYGVIWLIPFLDNLNWRLIGIVFFICFGLWLSYISGKDFIRQRAKKKHSNYDTATDR